MIYQQYLFFERQQVFMGFTQYIDLQERTYNVINYYSNRQGLLKLIFMIKNEITIEQKLIKDMIRYRKCPITTRS